MKHESQIHPRTEKGEATPANRQPVAPEVWTIGRILNWSKGYLLEHGSESPRVDAEVLLANSLRCSRVELYTQFDRPVTPDERQRFRLDLKRRGEHEPVSYITGAHDFMGHRFVVDASVLIPRPETELLVEMALAEMAPGVGGRVLDLCTGSGCVATSLALARPELEVHAWDVSVEALELATRNASKLGASVSFKQCDLRDASVWTECQGKSEKTGGDSAPCRYDLIVANPPYVSDTEMHQLPPDVRDFEPNLALGGGSDGLDFYKIFAKNAPALLTNGGRLLCEIGYAQGEKVSQVFLEEGWHDVAVALDYSQRPRVVTAHVAGGT